MKRGITKSRLVFLACLLLLSLPAKAQPALDAYHQALDAFEYEKAAELAADFPEPSSSLARAELATLARHYWRSFQLLQGIRLGQLSAQWHGKYYLVLARQKERSTEYPTAGEKTRAVSRLIMEGLKVANPHDRAMLLVARMEQGGQPVDEIALEISTIEGIDDTLILWTQAKAAASMRRYPLAAAFYRTLA